MARRYLTRYCVTSIGLKPAFVSIVKMEPCVRGFKDMFTLGYPGLEKYKPADFCDESFMEELDKSGFIDTAYKTAK